MTAVSPARAVAIARAATQRLAAMVRPDGLFLYRYALNDPSFVNTIYSEVRHVMAVWVLADVQREGWDMPELAPAVDRAARAMEERIFRPYGTSGGLCVLDEGLIKLGGSALGVAAEAALEARAPSAEHRDRIARLARHVASQREADGDFLPVRVPGPIPRPHPGRDTLTTGQAILALALAAEATGEESWLAVARDCVARLAARNHGVGTLAHWLLYGLEALDRVAPDDATLAYAARLVAGLDAVPLDEGSIPIACMSEGLLAYARVLRARGGREGEVTVLLGRVGQNLQRQLRYFHPSGAFVMSAARAEVRIDTIAHNLLGFLGYARLLRGGAANA